MKNLFHTIILLFCFCLATAQRLVSERNKPNAIQTTDTLHYYQYTFPNSQALYCPFQIIKRINANQAIVRIKGSILKPSAAIQALDNSLWKWYGYENHKILSYPQLFYVIKSDRKISTLSILNKKHLNTVLADPQVIGLELISRPAHTEFDLLGHDFSLNVFNQVKAQYPELQGNGGRISIKEALMDGNDLDLKNRYFNSLLKSNALNPHSTSMTTIIAGAGNTYKSGLGIAPKLRYTSSTYDSLQPNAIHILKAEQTYIQNHSYGVGIENFYGADALAYDLQTYTNKVMLHVFSVGNSGTATSTIGQYANIPNVANVTGNFKLAKNVITVGATDSFNILETRSSRGPAFDGRIKPDLVAFGQDGSSGAAAAVSGLSALCYELYKRSANKWPTAALIRSAIITGADRKSENAIHYGTGFGALNALQTLTIIHQKQYVEDSIKSGETKIIPLFVPPNLKSMRMTLVWHDTSATIFSQNALVNDLDFELLDANSVSYKPWVLNSYPHIDSLKQVAKRKLDTLNTIEHIALALPASGNYVLKVKARKMVSQQQHFAISYRFDTLNKFYFRYPCKADQLVPKEKQLLRWQSHLTDAFGKCYISYNLGTTWQLLKDSLPLHLGHAYFQTKDTNCFLLFKLETNTGVFYSDTITHFETIQPKIEYVCKDSSLLSWRKIKNCNQYSIAKMGAQYLENFKIINDTLLAIKNTAVDQITIAPIVNSKVLQTGYLIDYKEQGVNCYYNQFIAALYNENKGRIQLQLSTLKNVQSVEIEKRIGDDFITVFSSSVTDSPDFEYNDSQLFEGINSYRAMIKLNNQSQIFTDLSDIRWLAQSPFIMFPNPLRKDAVLNIWNLKEDVFYVNIYNAIGEIIYAHTYNSIYNVLDDLILNPGLYFVEIQNDLKTIRKQKLIVTP